MGGESACSQHSEAPSFFDFQEGCLKRLAGGESVFIIDRQNSQAFLGGGQISRTAPERPVLLVEGSPHI